MIKNILVPLDGSHLAEAAIPAAVTLGKVLKASITLLHVVEQDAPKTIHHDRHLSDASEAEAYLKTVADRLEIKAALHVHAAPVSNVAGSIVSHVIDEFQPDLIILSSHGNSGTHDLFFGNIAQQVAASSLVPVLLIKPTHLDLDFSLSRILVPLDNESGHDAVLPLAMELARAFQAQLDLLSVIPTRGTDSGVQAAAGTMLPVTAAAYLDIAEEMAVEHLQTHLDELFKQGLQATAEIARGDPASTILRVSTNDQTDLVIFGTHGRAGMDAFWNRSVSAGVARKTDLPLLLVPLSEKG